MTRDLVAQYIHKTVERRRNGVSLRFVTSQSLFSSNTIDPGTNLLIRMLTTHAGRRFENCLDLGCGYGPIGLSLAASGVADHVDMVDRDALAVELSQRNIELNRLEQVTVSPSLGYDDAPGDKYDLIVSNLPGKAGEQVLRHLITAVQDKIAAGGQAWIVVVSPLRSLVEQVLSDMTACPIHVEHGTRHSVYGYSPKRTAAPEPAQDSLSVGVYRRGSVEFTVGSTSYCIETSQGLDQFEGLSYSTKLVLERLSAVRTRHTDRAVLFNVGQGYVPVAVQASGMTDRMELVDRDLLALRTTIRNLQCNSLNDSAVMDHHQVGWIPPGDGRYGLIAGTLRGDEPQAAIDTGAAAVVGQLESGGQAVIAGGSTAVTRMLKSLSGRKDAQLIDRQRFRGSSVVAILKSS